MNLRLLKPGLLIVCSFLLQISSGALEPVSAKRGDKATVEPTELHLKDGMKKMKAGDYEGAGDEFLQACYFARNKYCPEGWLYLGLCYKAQRNYTKAIDALKTHLSQTTEKAADAHCDLAECYLNVGEYDKAEREVTYARIDADNSNHRVYYVLGELSEKMDKPSEALDAYLTALDARPWHYFDAWMGKARCEIKMRPPRYNEALKDYREIIEAAPGNKVNWVEIYYNMAQCLYKRGDHQGAIDHLLEALKVDPDHFDSHLALAKIFDEEKHITSAVNRYEHALRTAPKGYNTDQINKRLVFMQGQLSAQEKDKEVKPSPYMRQQVEQAQKQQQAPRGESGF
jgi:tetratricopeptide (TPR) repeat protein